MSTSQQALLSRAARVLPGGTFGNTAAELIIREGRGTHVWDESGNEYIDYLIGSGPMLIGHSHPEVTAAAAEQIHRGTTFFANNAKGIELAEVIVAAGPCAEKVRFASTGSEADAFAIRLARAYRRRSKILKFEGGYHGYSDYGLMSLAPGVSSNSARPIADSAGIPESIKDDILIAPYNDVDAVASLIAEHKNDIAAVFMEPVQRLIPPQPGFLEAMRQLTTDNDILLVFDEVVTGFRMAYGGAQEFYGVTPDLCTLGKAIGGGFPLSAIAGCDEVMSLFDKARAPQGHFVPQVGTLSGNPVAAAAGIATLNILNRPGVYERFHAIGSRLQDALQECIARHGLVGQVIGIPQMFDIMFADGEVRNYRDTQRGDSALLDRLNKLLHARGILKGASKYYIPAVLDDADIDTTIAAWDDAFAELVR